jgi:NAD(P)-dependent dehydrogenase (short-subunit alcohol dehydrogenase family)
MRILDSFTLKNKNIFVTGGARGIGKAIARGFCQAEASSVAIIDLDFEEAQKTVSELSQEGTEVFALKVDVTDMNNIENMILALKEKWHQLDVAVCNAGICINAPAEEMSVDDWNKVININLTGVFFTAQAAGKWMIERGNGSIIITASMSGHVVNSPQPQCAYNASKAGVIMLAKSMAVEWAQKGVRVNCISPGYTGTELTLQMTELFPIWQKHTPMKRLAKPEEITGAALYLASEASSFVTGEDIVIDGGLTCW